jgi:hypothetical protein
VVKINFILSWLLQGLTSKAQQGKYLKVICPVLAGVNEARDQKLLNMRWTNILNRVDY